MHLLSSWGRGWCGVSRLDPSSIAPSFLLSFQVPSASPPFPTTAGEGFAHTSLGEAGVTQRDMESVFDGVKCITNNKNIRNFELYHPSRFFILGEDDLSDLKRFLDEPFLDVPEEDLEKYSFR